MNSDITAALIIPSYNETLALPDLLRQIKAELTFKDAVIIMDDSPKLVSAEIELKCLEAIENSQFLFKFENSGEKLGRGSAVRRGIVLALSEFPNLEKILECDADGSHRPTDILKIKHSTQDADLLVGSRYLDSSKIVGWPASRRIFSFLLNKSIPRLTKVELQDITNGLRRYSKIAALEILSHDQINTGFIYLSEQAILISKANLKIAEEPIIFIDRTLGSSTVTWREISNSLQGIFKLIYSNRNL